MTLKGCAIASTLHDSGPYVFSALDLQGREGCHVSRGWAAAGLRRDGSERAGEQGGEEGPDKEPRRPNTVT